MSDTNSASHHAVVEFFRALSDRDVSIASAIFTTAFVEGRGDLIMKKTGQPYRNIYVFKFSIAEGNISAIREYANPVIYAKSQGLKLN